VWFVVVVRYVCVGFCVWCGCIVADSYPVFFFNEMKRSSPAFLRKKKYSNIREGHLVIKTWHQANVMQFSISYGPKIACDLPICF
jgi:hypothetical protein